MIDITLKFDDGHDARIVAEELFDAAVKEEARANRTTHTGRKAAFTRRAEVFLAAGKALLDGVREPV